MNLSIAVEIGETELSMPETEADASWKRDASAWEEAVDWGVPDCSTLWPSEWRITTAPDFD